jgi:hypothetical protein
LRLADDPIESARIWSQLGGMYRFMPVVDPKPGTRSLLIDRDSLLPVLTQISAGAGRAFFFGARETWRWRERMSGIENPQDRFWRQLLREAGPAPMAAHEGQIAFDVDPVSAEPGDLIRVRSRIIESKAAPTLLLRRDGQVIKKATIPPSSNRASGQYELTLRDLPAGEYQVSVSDGSTPGTLQVPLHIASDLRAELTDVSGEPARLARIASGTGGESLRMEDVSDLPRKIHESGERLPGFFEYPLWDSAGLFWFVTGCLGLEWAMRKRLGLA